MNRPALRVLSLDGGGVRGLSSLYLLRSILDKTGGKDALAQPWKYFDLIGGTSTGGLIAIMIGQLKMSIPECIEQYGHLSKHVFGSRSLTSRVFGRLGAAAIGETQYHSTRLVEVIENLLREHLPADQKRLIDDDCPVSEARLRLPLNLQTEYPKVFVATLQQERGNPILLTNYETDVEDNQFEVFTILEAARATSAASLIFESLEKEVEGVRFSFVDAGLGYNCPIELVMNEARRIWDKRPFGCILSIGTGIQPKRPVGGNLKTVAEKCAEMAASADKIARSYYLGLQGEKSELLQVYFRLNVDQGLGDIGLDKYEKLSTVAACTTDYLRDNRGTVDEISKRLKDPTPPSTVQDVEAISNHLINRRRTRAYVERFHTNALGQVDSSYVDLIHHELVKQERPSTVALLGMGGAGKSQLALAYASQYAYYYVATLWIDMTKVPQCIKDIAHATRVGGATTGEQLLAVHKWLVQQRRPWLLVLDNLDTASHFDYISTLCPDNLKGHVLVTSRNTDINNYAAAIIRVGPMSKSEATKLLIRRVRGPNADRQMRSDQYENLERAAAEDIVEFLGFLPLAVEIVGALIQKEWDEHPSISGYLRKLLDAPIDDLMERDPGQAFVYGRESAWASEVPEGIKKTLLDKKHLYRTLASVWSCSVEYLKTHAPDSLRILQLFGFLSLRNLDRDLFRYAVEDSRFREHEPGSSLQIFEEERLPAWLEEIIGKNRVFNGKRFDESISVLQSLSLISVVEPEGRGWGENPYRFEETRGSDSRTSVNSTYQLHSVISRCVQVLSEPHDKEISLHAAVALVSHLPVEFIHSSEIMRVLGSARGAYELENPHMDLIFDWQHRNGFKESILEQFVAVFLNAEFTLPEDDRIGSFSHLWSGQRFMLVFAEYGLFGPCACIWSRMSGVLTPHASRTDKSFSKLGLAWLFTFATKAHARDRRWAEANQDMYMAASILVSDLHRCTMAPDELTFLVDCLLSIWAQSRFLDIVPEDQNVVQLLRNDFEVSQEDVTGLQDLIDTIGQLLEKEIDPLVPDGCQNGLLKDLSLWAKYFKHDVFLKLEKGWSDYDENPHTTNWVAEVRNVMANTAEERMEVEHRVQGDWDEELRRNFGRKFVSRKKPLSVTLRSFFERKHREQKKGCPEDREAIYTRKHQEKMWAKTEDIGDRNDHSGAEVQEDALHF